MCFSVHMIAKSLTKSCFINVYLKLYQFPWLGVGVAQQNLSLLTK